MTSLAITLVNGSLALSLIVKATAVTSAAFIAARICRRYRAAVRHLVYVGAFIILLVLPLASLVLPPLTVRAPVNRIAADGTSFLIEEAVQPGNSGAGPTTKTSRSVLPFAEWGRRAADPRLLAGMWAMGTLIFLVPVGIGLWRSARINRRASPCVPGQRLIDDLASAWRLRRTVRVLHSEEENGFFSFGWLRPVILVSSDAASLPSDALRRVLLHELEHVRRFDYATLLLSRVTCAIYWFHPLVWLARHELDLAAEYACDDAVVRVDDPAEYAALLVAVAKRSLGVGSPWLAIARHGDLSSRIRAVLDRNRSRTGLSRSSSLTAIAMSVILAFTLAPRMVLTATAVQQSTTTDGTVAPGRLTFEAASIKPSQELRPRVSVQGGGYVATGMSLRDLLKGVFLVHPTQLVGGPDWMDSSHFDISARTQSPPAGNVIGMKPFVRSLLEDRFGLRTHMETRELDALVLVRVHPSAPLLPGLQPSQSTCEGTAEDRRAHRRKGWPPCEAMQITNVPGAGTKGETTDMKVSAYTMDQFAGYVGAILDGPAVNQTGLSGRFDLEFSYVRPLPDALPGDPLPEGPRLARAVEEQLGLRVERRRVSVPVVVIDAVALPSPD